MFYWQALGAFVMVLALPAYADIPSELTHRLEQYPEVVHRFNQYPEVIHMVGQHGGSDVVEPKPLCERSDLAAISARADVIYKTISKLTGITVAIDRDFKPQKIMVLLTDVTTREALDLVGLKSKTVWRALTPSIIFVYPKDAR